MRVISSLMLACLMSGCAVVRSTIDVPVGQPEPVPAKAFVKLTGIKDVRKFEAAPSDPSVPSLQNPEEIKDPAITSRAIARKRGGFGAALADILLPEGRTVEQVVREATTKAVNEKGYSVVDERSPDYGKALPLQIDIKQFWAWFTPGFVQVSVEFEGILLVRGEALTGRKEEPVRGYAILKGLAATDREWQEVMQMGIADLVANLKAKIRPAN